MGVYIPSLKMPQTCEDCVLESYCNLWVDTKRLCGETFTDINSRIEATIRHPDCPLIEVPSHGRLIDADALISVENRTRTYYPKSLDESLIRHFILDYITLEQVKTAPTILEAEEGE